jgi:hypothetical protein
MGEGKMFLLSVFRLKSYYSKDVKFLIHQDIAMITYFLKPISSNLLPVLQEPQRY